MSHTIEELKKVTRKIIEKLPTAFNTTQDVKTQREDLEKELEEITIEHQKANEEKNLSLLLENHEKAAKIGRAHV